MMKNDDFFGKITNLIDFLSDCGYSVYDILINCENVNRFSEIQDSV